MFSGKKPIILREHTVQTLKPETSGEKNIYEII